MKNLVKELSNSRMDSYLLGPIYQMDSLYSASILNMLLYH